MPGFTDRLTALLPALDRAPLRRRRARRLHPAPERRHLGRPRARARGDRTAQPGRHAHRLRPDPQHLAARRLPHGVPGARRAGGPRRAGRGPPPADGRHQRRALRRAPTCSARSTRSRPRSRTATSARAPRASSPPPPTAAFPHMRLNDGNLVQLGYGAAPARIWTAETDHTSAIAEGIASDKDLTKSLLAGCGVPVPEGQVVDSAEEAWEAAAGHRPAGGGQAVGRQPRPRRRRSNCSTREDVDGRLRRGRAGGQRRDGRALRARPRAPPAGGRRPVVAAARGEIVIGDRRRPLDRGRS